MNEEWWYCLKHNRVESSGCPNAERLGPYESRAAAERALEGAAERTQAWDNDPRWNDES